MYKVVKKFVDLQDKNHLYNVGDCYPRSGKSVSENRIHELATNNNKIGVPLIKEIPVKPTKRAPKKEVEQTEE